VIRNDIKTYLSGIDGLTAMIGTTPFRLALSKILEKWCLPACAYRRMTGGHQHDLSGSAGYAEGKFDFEVLGHTPEVVEAICEQLRLALQGYPPDTLMGTTMIAVITLDDEVDGYYESQAADDNGANSTTLTFTIGYYEAIPSF
jgi:hypothetical protein